MRRISPGAVAQSTDRTVTDVVRPSDVRQNLARLPASDRLPALMAGKLGLATEDNAPCLCTLPPLPRPRPDQFAFKLRQSSQHGQHQTTVRRRRVSPSVSERFEACPFFPDRPQQVQEIARGPRQTIEPRDDQYVALREKSHQPSQLFAV